MRERERERERERGEWGRMSRCANGKRERKKDVKDREREGEKQLVLV